MASCEAGNPSLFYLQARGWGPQQVISSCRYGNRTRGRGGWRPKKEKKSSALRQGTRMGASDNVGSAASGGVLAGQVGLVSTVGQDEWLAACQIHPGELVRYLCP